MSQFYKLRMPGTFKEEEVERAVVAQQMEALRQAAPIEELAPVVSATVLAQRLESEQEGIETPFPLLAALAPMAGQAIGGLIQQFTSGGAPTKKAKRKGFPDLSQILGAGQSVLGAVEDISGEVRPRRRKAKKRRGKGVYRRRRMTKAQKTRYALQAVAAGAKREDIAFALMI